MTRERRDERLLGIARRLREANETLETIRSGASSGGRPGETVSLQTIDGQTIRGEAGDNIYPGQPAVAFDRGDGQPPIILPSGIHSDRGINGQSLGPLERSGDTRCDRSIDIRRNRREDEDEPEQLESAAVYIAAVRRYIRAAKVGVIYSLVEDAEVVEGDEGEDEVVFEYACPRYYFGIQDGEDKCIPTADPTAPYDDFRECAAAHPIIECSPWPPQPPAPSNPPSFSGGSSSNPNFFYAGSPWEEPQGEKEFDLPTAVIKRRLQSAFPVSGGGGSSSASSSLSGSYSPGDSAIQPAEPVNECLWVHHYGDQIKIIKHKASKKVYSYGLFAGVAYHTLPGTPTTSPPDQFIAYMAMNSRDIPYFVNRKFLASLPNFTRGNEFRDSFTTGREYTFENDEGQKITRIVGHYPRWETVVNNTNAFEVLAIINKPPDVLYGGAEETMCREMSPNDPWNPTSYTPTTPWTRRDVDGPPVSSGTWTPPPEPYPPNCEETDPPEGVGTGQKRVFYVGGFQAEPIKIHEINLEEEFEAYITIVAEEWKAVVKWGKEPSGDWCKVKTFGGRVNQDWQSSYSESKEAVPDVNEGLTQTHQGEDANIDKQFSDYLFTIDRQQTISSGNSITNKNQSLEDELLSVVMNSMEDLEDKETIPVNVEITPILNRNTEELGDPFSFSGMVHRLVYEDMVEEGMEIVYANGCPYIGEIHQISPWRAKL